MNSSESYLNHLLTKILKRRQDEKNQIVGTEFLTPARNKLRVHLFFEILTAEDFEYDDIYVQYNIDLPKNWQVEDEKYLYGSTNTCKTKSWKKIANFGHHFEVCLEYNMKEFYKQGFPKVPYIYFQVISRDYWDRYRCEGLTYKALPIFQNGLHKFRLQCLRICPKSPLGDLRRYFIGDYGSVDDITWIGLPKDYEDSIINKFGVKTIGTGTLDFRLNILNQCKNFARLGSQSDNKTGRVEGMGAFSLVKSVEEVVLAFRKAQERMQKARKIVLERKKIEDED